jgi:lipopolysaccharide/colanic/teichoic acid biosynthesis glycosyltransferase
MSEASRSPGPRPLLALKRAVDVVATALLLVPALPVMAAVSIAVLLDSPGPVLFRQEREGMRGRLFRIYKFRSMVVDAERGGPVMSMEDPRVTPVGRFIRRTSLDELPQLFNVLRGDMSLVGPRPLLRGTTRPSERRRLAMRPGMTGLVEVSEPHRLDWDQRMRVDIAYVDRWSPWLDVSILVRTVGVLFSRKDVMDTPRSDSGATEGTT